MWTMQRRADSRTRTLWVDGQEWRVEERADRIADREERLLVFSSAEESHAVSDYHWLWFSFMDEELAAVCRSRRSAAETAGQH